MKEKLPKEMLMKTQRDHSSQINKNHPKPPAAKKKKTSASKSDKAKKKDTIEVSSRSDEVRRLIELAKLAPDVRSEKIEAIKKQIKAGTYRVSADSVARSIADLHRKLKCDDR